MLPILADWSSAHLDNVVKQCYSNFARSLKKNVVKLGGAASPTHLFPPLRDDFPQISQLQGLVPSMDFQGTGLQSGHLIVRSTVKAAEARIHVLDVGSGSKKWGGFNTPQSLAEW